MLNQKIGRLKVVAPIERTKPGERMRWRCLCQCGQFCTRTEQALKLARRAKQLSGCDTCRCLVRGGAVHAPRVSVKQVEKVTRENFPDVLARFTEQESEQFQSIMANHKSQHCEYCRRGDTRECRKEAVEIVVCDRDSRERIELRPPLHEQRDFRHWYRG